MANLVVAFCLEGLAAGVLQDFGAPIIRTSTGVPSAIVMSLRLECLSVASTSTSTSTSLGQVREGERGRGQRGVCLCLADTQMPFTKVRTYITHSKRVSCWSQPGS